MIILLLVQLLSNQNQSSNSDQENNLAFLDVEPRLEDQTVGAAIAYIFQQEKGQRTWISFAFKIVASIYLGLCYYTLTPTLFDFTSISFFLYIIVWIAISMSFWPFMAKKPAEPNTFQPEDVYHIDMYSRAYHVSILAGFLALEVIFYQIYFRYLFLKYHIFITLLYTLLYFYL
jgi:hypothetical protein